MDQLDNFLDRAKQEVLYEVREGGEVALMLTNSKSNKYLTTKMIQWSASVRGVTSGWKGKYKHLFDEQIGYMECQFMSVEGYGKEMAIKMKAEQAKVDRIEKKGFMGLFKNE